MIESMEKIYIYALDGQSTDIIEDMMRCGAIQPTASQSMLDEDVAKTLAPAGSVDLFREESLLERLRASIGALKEFSKKKGLFSKRQEVTYDQLTDDDLMMEAMEACSKVESIVNISDEYKKELAKLEFRKTSYLPWENFDLSIEDMETASSKFLCYILQEPRTSEDIKKAAEEKELNLYVHQVKLEGENQYLTVLFHKKDEQTVRETVSVFGAKEFSLEGLSGTFKENVTQCCERIAELEKKLEDENEKRKAMADKLAQLEMAYDAVKARIDCLKNRDNLLRTDKVDIITGWVPTSKKHLVDEKLKGHTCYCQYQKPEKDEDFPVLLKNSKLVEPFSAITEMYSMPHSNSIDTNWAIGLFFFIFFGMMLSDAGYGLVLLIGGTLAVKFLDLKDGAKRMVKMLSLCGISTIFWGALYGSWFGDAIPTIAKTFFGKEMTMPTLIDPLKEPMTILIMSCIFGVVHLFIGMGIKGYIMIKRGDKWGALFDVGFWYIFLIGLPLLLVPGVANKVGIVMSIVGAAGLVLTQGRAKPTIVGKITSGVMSLYDVTGYFSDVLSYSRILALGLATGVVGSVVNIMGSMAGGTIVGAILFIVIFVAGHMLNLGINALGAYVHSARLQYVEFFGKYYESGGKKFTPLTADTKYVKITEEK